VFHPGKIIQAFGAEVVNAVGYAGEKFSAQTAAWWVDDIYKLSKYIHRNTFFTARTARSGTRDTGITEWEIF
jgi:hypothetical protein